MKDIILDYNHGDNEYGMTFFGVIICIFLNIIVSGAIGTVCAFVFTLVCNFVGETTGSAYDRLTMSHECRLHYRTYIHEKGWGKYSYDGEESGSKGNSQSIEAIMVCIDIKDERFEGDVMYQSYMQRIGWEDVWIKNGEISGIEDSDKRMEAFRVKLEGEMSNYYDVYYRAYVQKHGWLAWTNNGGAAGTAGFGLRLECIMIRLVPRDEIPPENVVHKTAFLINETR